MPGKIVVLLCSLLLLSGPASGQGPLRRTLSISFSSEPIDEALLKLSEASASRLAFNPDLLPDKKITSSYHSEPLKVILDDLLDHRFQYKVRGSYVVIQPEEVKEAKSEMVIAGEITDATTGEKLSDVTIYEVNRLTATLSSSTGSYNLSSKVFGERAVVAISKKNYQDTIITVDKSAGGFLNLSLKPLLKKRDGEKEENPADKTGIFKWLVNDKAKKHTENVNLNETRFIQLSLAPGIGTNGFLGGKVSNLISINLVGGYEYALNGVEFGGAFNLTRQEVSGLQMAGAANIAGGKTSGVQMAGAVNSSWGEVNGYQAAGAVNIANGKMTGIQVAGAYNFAKDAQGSQLAGALNTSENLKGVQLAGAVNIAEGKMSGVQIAGAINFSNDSKGVQLSGAVNTAENTEGIQLSGAINRAKSLKGIQVTAAYNHVVDTARGLQLSGGANYAGRLSGVQLGIINIAGVVERGVMVGLLNFTKNGILAFEVDHNDVTDYNFSFKSGTKAFYTILSAGMSHDPDLFGFGGGFGTQIGIGRQFYTGLELSSHQLLIPNSGVSEDPDLAMDHRLNVSFGYSFTKRIAISGGPVLHFMHYRPDSPDTPDALQDIGKNPLFEHTENGTTRKWWIGYRFALRL